MGLFNLFKKNKPAPSGTSLEDRNKQYLEMRDREVARLHRAYDLETVEGIMSIPVPCKEVNGDSATGRVEYYLRGALFAQYDREGKVELALACLRKAQELMYISDMIWKRQDFFRLVEYLYQLGMGDEADAELLRIDSFFSDQQSRLGAEVMQRTLETARFLETDLLEVTDSGVCCAKCAMYRNRIYSISGKDKRFPIFPSDFHHNCGLRAFAFVDGVSEPTFKCRDIVKHSNRPFVDDRTAQQKELHEQWRNELAAKADAEQRRAAERLENAKNRQRDSADFQWVQTHLPHICPKSLSGFQRMRATNSKNYQRIIAEAAKLGKSF